MIIKFVKSLSLFAILLVSLVAMTGCDRDEGGMEEMGENMDEAATDFGNAIEDSCEEMKEGVDAENTNC